MHKYFSPSENIKELSKTKDGQKGLNKSNSMNSYPDINSSIVY